MSLFRAQDEGTFDVVRAEVTFVTDLQLEIEAALDRQGLTQRDLAKALGVSEGRISQILSENGANLEARTIAKIAHALGMEAKLKFWPNDVETKSASDAVCLAEWTRAHGQASAWARSVLASNDDGWASETREGSQLARAG